MERVQQEDFDQQDRIEVRARGPLEGSVAIGGAKNSVLKLMAACLLAEGTSVIRNVPDIDDVVVMADVLRAMGASVSRLGDALTIDRPAVITPEAPYALTEQLRASTAVLGPLLAGAGHARVALPGGDDFGPRPIDMHIAALEAIGCRFEISGGDVHATADNLVGSPVLLEFPSVGATENVMMAAVRAKGTTVIDNAAREPEIVDLAGFLNRDGWPGDRGGHVHHHGGGCGRTAPGRAHRDERSDRGGHVPGRPWVGRRGDHPAGGPARPHGNALPQAGARWACEPRRTPKGCGP